MIKIISGYTNAGGSTVMLINLTNEFNKRGYDAIMYGYSYWFLNKCRSDSLPNLEILSSDNLIIHYSYFNSRPDVRKILMVNHEKEWSILPKINKFWDKIIFSTEENRKFHSYTENYAIIPNIKSELHISKKDNVKDVAGVIGTIEPRKQTHLSIKKAIDDGYSKILIFGNIGNVDYFKENVKPLLNDNIILKGYEEDKQKMYDQINAVYMLSKSEVATLVKDDCYLTNTEFIGNENTSHEVSSLTNDEIIDMWLKELDLK